MAGKTQAEEASTTDSLIIEGFSNLPTLELTVGSDGAIRYRYMVEDGDYPGFDGQWRVMIESERREHLRLGGRIADWLQNLA